MKSANYSTKTISFLLAAYPILSIYRSPISIVSWADLLFVLFLGFCVLKNKGSLFSFPPGYITFWVGISILNIIVSVSHFKMTTLIPGGFSFTLFSIILGISLKYVDYTCFLKYYRLIFICAACVLLFQELMWFTVGYRIPFLIPLGSLTDGTPMSVLLFDHMYGDRSSSFFREPAHFAQYSLPLLALELFGERNKEKMFSRMSIFIIITLIFLRSGNGFLSMLILLSVKMFVYLSKSRSKYRFIILAVTLCVGLFAAHKYIATEAGESMLNRTEEMANDESAASFIRIYRGYRVFSEFPLSNKIMGMHMDDVLALARNSSVSHLYTGEFIYDTYYNGVQNLLLYTGILGTFLFFLVLYKLFKKNSIAGKLVIVVFIVISFIAQTYLTYLMLFTLFISTQEQKIIKDESSILY